MRYYGEVDWFGGHNNKQSVNDFGFIVDMGNNKLNSPKIYFRKQDILSNIKEFTKGTLVCFEISDDSKEIKAINVDLLTNEKDMDVLERCLNSEYPIIWLSVIKVYSKQVPLKQGIIRIEEKLKYSFIGDSISLIEYLPLPYYVYSKIIRNHLKINEKLNLYYALLKKDYWVGLIKDDILEELVETINELEIPEKDLLERINIKWFKEYVSLRNKISDINFLISLIKLFDSSESNNKVILDILKANNYKQQFLDLIPIKIIIDNLWEYLPKELQLQYFERNLVLSTNIDLLIQILKEVPETIRFEKLKNLSKDLKMHPKLFYYLAPIDKVNQIWETNNTSIISLWNQLDYKTKLFHLYRLAKNDNRIDFLINVNETHPIIRSVMKIIWVKDIEKLKQKSFQQAHELIQDYIVDMAWNVTDNIDIFPLLPECPFGYVDYCEGKPWHREDGHFVYCPRKNTHCDFEKDKSSFKIYPNTKLPWENWTLFELLEFAGVTPFIYNLKQSDQYIPKLSGWVNRLNEIREVLKCSHCDKTLISNKEYSKNLAAYNSTVFYCECGNKDNSSIYISHCWACREIIDSRRDNYKMENYYLCIDCGSGPRQHTDYRQGSICPKCGSTHMVINNLNNRKYKCGECNHIITIPPDQKLTGSK